MYNKHNIHTIIFTSEKSNPFIDAEKNTLKNEANQGIFYVWGMYGVFYVAG